MFSLESNLGPKLVIFIWREHPMGFHWAMSRHLLHLRHHLQPAFDESSAPSFELYLM
jgi:hypothetical protein